MNPVLFTMNVSKTQMNGNKSKIDIGITHLTKGQE